VATDEQIPQNLDLQLDALEAAGCKRVFRDLGSGSLKHRPQLTARFDYLRTGDTLVVWRLDRLGRGLKHLIESIDELHAREVGFRSLNEAIDTTRPACRLQFHIFGALAEFEREIIRERTRAGLAAARARGRIGGRPSSVSVEKLAAAEAMRALKHPMREIAAAVGVSRATLYRHMAGSDESASLGAVLDEHREQRRRGHERARPSPRRWRVTAIRSCAPPAFVWRGLNAKANERVLCEPGGDGGRGGKPPSRAFRGGSASATKPRPDAVMLIGRPGLSRPVRN
jgi:DNA invertase Pin-like site-specific DNA recombinase